MTETPASSVGAASRTISTDVGCPPAPTFTSISRASYPSRRTCKVRGPAGNRPRLKRPRESVTAPRAVALASTAVTSTLGTGSRAASVITPVTWYVAGGSAAGEGAPCALNSPGTAQTRADLIKTETVLLDMRSSGFSATHNIAREHALASEDATCSGDSRDWRNLYCSNLTATSPTTCRVRSLTLSIVSNGVWCAVNSMSMTSMTRSPASSSGRWSSVIDSPTLGTKYPV